MSVGTVTTGDPGTEAAVTNSGTENAAVLNFTIPKGQDGAAAPVELLSAYSTPSQSVSSGDSLIFDRNDLNYGTSIAHSSNSSAFTISQPGIYTVSFHSSAAPATGDTLPLNLLFYLNLNGTSVAGGGAEHTFTSAVETANLAFSVPVAVSTVPATLNVVGEGGDFLYSSAGMTIQRQGDIPS